MPTQITDPLGHLWSFGWNGYFTDSLTGLLLCGSRWYDPASTRWLSRDPIGFLGGPNLYAYVMNNPVTGADPSGLCGDPNAARNKWNAIRDLPGMQIPMDFLENRAAAASGDTDLQNQAARALAGDMMLMGLTSEIPGLGGIGGDAGEGGIFYHGTDVDSAVNMLNGHGLDADAAAANNIDGDGGFYLADKYDDAAYFGARSRGGVIKCKMTGNALRQLNDAGAKLRPIPNGGPGSFQPAGNEFYIPPSAYNTFNNLNAAGEITFTPVR